MKKLIGMKRKLITLALLFLFVINITSILSQEWNRKQRNNELTQTYEKIMNWLGPVQVSTYDSR